MSVVINDIQFGGDETNVLKVGFPRAHGSMPQTLASLGRSASINREAPTRLPKDTSRHESRFGRECFKMGPLTLAT